MIFSPPPADRVPPRNTDFRAPATRSVSPLLAVVRYPCFETHTGMYEANAAHLALIRSFFLEPQSSYTFTELALLWQVPVEVVHDIYEDRCPADADAAHGSSIPWVDAVGTSITFNLLRPYDVERALGAEFSLVRSEEWRTIPILIRLPRFVLNAVAARASLRPDTSASLQVEQFILELLSDELRGCRS